MVIIVYALLGKITVCVKTETSSRSNQTIMHRDNYLVGVGDSSSVEIRNKGNFRREKARLIMPIVVVDIYLTKKIC